MARMDAPRDPLAPRSRRWAMLIAAIVVIGGAIAVRGFTGGEADAKSPRPAAAKRQGDKPLRPAEPQHDVMAIVNGQDISRTALAQACVERFGEDVLESLVNKRLIEHHCRNRGVSVTQNEIEAEVDRMAKRFKLGREQWLGLLQDERGVKPEEYKRDILWPTLALRKLAAKDLTVLPHH